MEKVWAITAVAVGAALGGAARFLIQQSEPFGWSALNHTILINSVGSLVIGVVLFFIDRLSFVEKSFVITGILGGFTTFSSLSAELFLLIEKGEVLAALQASFISVFVGVALCAAGYFGMKSLT